MALKNEIPYFAIPEYPGRGSKVAQSVNSGWLTSGPMVREFERQLSRRFERDVVAVNSCTAALHLSLLAAGIGPGDKVIVPTLTFAATAEVVIQCGAIPILVDVDAHTLAINDESAADMARSLGARACLPVHYAGQAIEIPYLSELASGDGWEQPFDLVEDAAHAFPSRHRDGALVGSRPHSYACFSFYANKTLTTAGEGGAVACPPGTSERIRRLSLHGLSKDAWTRYEKGAVPAYDIIEFGLKYNMPDPSAAMGLEQLPHVDAWTTERARLATAYRRELETIDGGRGAVWVVADEGTTTHSHHLFVVAFRSSQLRDDVARSLQTAGVGVSLHYRPLHLHTAYRRGFGYSRGEFPVAEWAYERILSLPIYPALGTDAVSRICSIVSNVIARS